MIIYVHGVVQWSGSGIFDELMTENEVGVVFLGLSRISANKNSGGINHSTYHRDWHLHYNFTTKNV